MPDFSTAANAATGRDGTDIEARVGRGFLQPIRSASPGLSNLVQAIRIEALQTPASFDVNYYSAMTPNRVI
jgi:hypothetical protein